MYKIEYLDNVVQNDIPSLPKKAKVQIKKAIEERLTLNPVELGKPLRHSLKGLRRLRVGDCRVVFKIEEKKSIVLIVKIGNRKDVYK